MNTIQRGALGLIALALLAGCSSGQPSATLAPVAAASPVAPSPTHPTRAQAAAHYLAIVAPSNADLDQLDAMWKRWDGKSRSTRVPASYHRLAAKMQADLRTGMAQLLVYDWPAEVKPTAGQVADSMAPEVTLFGQLAEVKTLGAAQDISDSAPASDSSAAEKIRVQLGLPAVTSP